MIQKTISLVFLSILLLTAKHRCFTTSPSFPKPALTEEEVERKSNAIIGEYLLINDLKVIISAPRRFSFFQWKKKILQFPRRLVRILSEKTDLCNGMFYSCGIVGGVAVCYRTQQCLIVTHICTKWHWVDPWTQRGCSRTCGTFDAPSCQGRDAAHSAVPQRVSTQCDTIVTIFGRSPQCLLRGFNKHVLAGWKRSWRLRRTWP